jgi:hypothetical protein
MIIILIIAVAIPLGAALYALITMLFEAFETVFNASNVLVKIGAVSVIVIGLGFQIWYVFNRLSKITPKLGEEFELVGSLSKICAFIFLFTIVFPILSYFADENGVPHGTFTLGSVISNVGGEISFPITVAVGVAKAVNTIDRSSSTVCKFASMGGRIVGRDRLAEDLLNGLWFAIKFDAMPWKYWSIREQMLKHSPKESMWSLNLQQGSNLISYELTAGYALGCAFVGPFS